MIACNRISAQAGFGNAVNQRQNIVQSAVSMQKVACVYQQIDLLARRRPPHLLDLRMLTAVRPSKMRVRKVKDVQPLSRHPRLVPQQPHRQSLGSHVKRLIQKCVAAKCRA